jgi:hypothetical protein
MWRNAAGGVMTVQVECSFYVKDDVAQALPKRPDLVQTCMAEAEQSMAALAKQRGRHLSGPPRFTDARPNGLGFVELWFTAETEAG